MHPPRKASPWLGLTALAATGLAALSPQAARAQAVTPAAVDAPGAPAAAAPPLPTAVPPSDPRIRYVGRFDTRQSAGPRCAWSASRVELRFTGAGLNVVLGDTGDDAYEVLIDGAAPAVLTAHKGTAVYGLLRDTGAVAGSGAHTVVLVKRTEPLVGTTQFLGFQLSAGGHPLPPPPPAPRRLEVIGDSISCGYGDEGKDRDEHFSPATENAFLSYGAVAARTLGADYTCVAWSGRTMWPTNTMPEVYGRTLPDDPTSRWDPAKGVPDAVVINLATNDFGKENPDRAAWVAAYEGFLARVRKAYPRATIYCASGPMMSDNWPPGHQALTTLGSYLSRIVADEHQAGDRKVRPLVFAPQSAQDGYGADWHPSLRTQANMAAALVKALGEDLGWAPPKTPAPAAR